jgi:MFS family permease
MSNYSTTAVRAWLVVGLLWNVALLNYLDRMMIASMRTSLVASIPMTEGQFGLLTSAFLWVYAGLSPVAGYLADRVGRSRVIVSSLLVWSLVTWLTTLAHSFSELVAARALMGISEACYLPAALALIADYHRGPTRSLATGIHITGLYVGSALGGIGGFLAESMGWRFGFSLFGVIGVCYAVLLAFTLRDVPAEPAVVKSEDEPAAAPQGHVGLLDAIGALLCQPAFLILLVIFALFSLVNWCFLQWLPTYMQEHFQLTQSVAGPAASVPLQVGGLIGILLGGFLADWWSRTNVRGRLLVPFLGTCLAGPFIVYASATSLLPMALLGFGIYGAGRGFCDANWMPVLCQIADRRCRATGYGVMNLLSCLVGGGMTYAGGVMRDSGFGLGSIFQVLGLLFFVAGWFFLFIRPRRELEA